MAVRYNPFTKLKLHGGSYIAPAGAEPFYKGQELAQVTEQEDFVELEKRVVYEEEGLTPLTLHRAADVEAGGDVTKSITSLKQPLLSDDAPFESPQKLLPFESQSLDTTKIDAAELLRLPRPQRIAVIQRLLEDTPVDSVAFLDKIRQRMDTYVLLGGG